MLPATAERRGAAADGMAAAARPGGPGEPDRLRHPARGESHRPGAARGADRQRRALLGVAAGALAVDERIVSVDGGPHRHPVLADDRVAEVLRTGRTVVV